MTQRQAYFQTIEHEGPAAAARLKELGLSMDGLLAVVEQGEHARAQATKHDPQIAASLDAWRYRVRGLRDTYCCHPFDWLLSKEDHLETIVSACGRRSIGTRAGDRNVGLPKTHPQTKTDVGEMTAKRVSANGSLFLDSNWLNVGTPVVHGADMWLLLVYRDESDVARAELSLPSGIYDGEVSGWIERILLPPIDLTKARRGLVPNDVVEVEDVPVVRKRRQ